MVHPDSSHEDIKGRNYEPASRDSSFSEAADGVGGRDARGPSGTARKHSAPPNACGVPDDDDPFADLTDGERAELEAVRAEEALLAKARRWANTYRMTIDDAEAFLRAGYTESTLPDLPAARKAMAKYLRNEHGTPPKWLLITGLFPEVEAALPHGDRRRRLRKLMTEVATFIRAVLKESEADPNRAERTVYWDPVREICRELGISQSKMSGFCWDFSGLSLKETVDVARAEGLKEKLKGNIRREWLQKGADDENREWPQKTQRGAKNGKSRVRCAVFVAWEELRAVRREDPRWSLDGWARSLGFASYRRMYKACVVVYGKSPRELEMDILGELLTESKLGEMAKDGVMLDRHSPQAFGCAECLRGTRRPTDVGKVQDVDCPS